jgi:hypothetical protein
MVPASYVLCNIRRNKCVSVVHVCCNLQYSWFCTYVYGVTTSLCRVVLLYAVMVLFFISLCTYVGWVEGWVSVFLSGVYFL